jgi:spermidine synthase
VPTHLAEVPLRYLTDAVLPTLFTFPADMARVPAEVNRLDNQILVQYYDQEWKKWN